MRTLGQIEGWGCNEGNNGRAYATEHSSYPWHIHETVEEKGYDKDDDERGQSSPKGRAQRAALLA